MAILVIHAGGTIGMKHSRRGFIPGDGVVEAAIERLRQSGELRADVSVLALNPLIDSANATPADWSRIATTIADNHARFDGFVVTHGTDTLAFTAAALCFALVGLSKPVLVTGSMLPLTVGGSDGVMNLSDALDAAQLAPSGVWVQFAGKRMHGARVRKTHSSAMDAFTAPLGSAPPLVPGPELRLCPYGAPDIAILSMAPGVSGRVVGAALNSCDGLVLRCSGSGTVPGMPELTNGLRHAQDRGAPIIAVSQCPEGRLALGTYAAGAVLIDNGVVDGRDITVEAAYAKLAHVLAYSDDPDVRRARLGRLLCGEASL